MLTAAFLLLTASRDCPAPARQIAISAVPVTGEALGGRKDPSAPARYRVGSFNYDGLGVEQTSSDPIFKELVLDQRLGLRHRCGNRVSGPGAWNARDKNVFSWSLEIEAGVRSPEPSPGSFVAEDRGAQAVFRGYLAGAAWPVHSVDGSFFMGLMHPEDSSAETLVVAFRDAPQPTPALVMGRLPMKFDTLWVLPDLHSPTTYLNLDGFSGGRLTRVVFSIDRETMLATHSKLKLTQPGTP